MPSPRESGVGERIEEIRLARPDPHGQSKKKRLRVSRVDVQHTATARPPWRATKQIAPAARRADEIARGRVGAQHEIRVELVGRKRSIATGTRG
jgi:hypothetical protein